MRALYLDLSNGLSWDMLLGSMLSLLNNDEVFLDEFEKAGFGYEYSLHINRTFCKEQSCCLVELVSRRPMIKCGVSKADTEFIISISGISEQAKRTACKMLNGIQEDEAAAVLPIALAIAVDMLKIDKILFSPLNIGKHNLPADKFVLLSSMTIYQDSTSDVPLDLKTAEMLKAVACESRDMPAMRLIGVGCGCGKTGSPLKAYLMDSLEYAYYEGNAALQINITQIFECKCENRRKQ